METLQQLRQIKQQILDNYQMTKDKQTRKLLRLIDKKIKGILKNEYKAE